MKEKFVCLNCGIEKERGKNTTGKYCSNSCQHEYQIKERIAKWKNGGSIHKHTLKRYLSDQKDGCWECGITEWNGKPIVLELEHIDGNSSNDNEENLSLLCPNCHSQTSTFKGRNKGNGRHYRRVRYSEGKSF